MLFDRKFPDRKMLDKKKYFDCKHNPYIGTFHQSLRMTSSHVDKSRHNPYLGYMEHAPQLQTLGFKCLVDQDIPIAPPFFSQLRLSKEKSNSHLHLHEKSLASMPISKYSLKSSEGEDYEEICPICLDVFDEGDDMRILPNCSHGFHRSCIDTWLVGTLSDIDTLTSVCPTCRQLADQNCMETDIPNESFCTLGDFLYEYSFCGEFPAANGLTAADSDPLDFNHEEVHADNMNPFFFLNPGMHDGAGHRGSLSTQDCFFDLKNEESSIQDFNFTREESCSLSDSVYSDCGFPLK